MPDMKINYNILLLFDNFFMIKGCIIIFKGYKCNFYSDIINKNGNSVKLYMGGQDIKGAKIIIRSFY